MARAMRSPSPVSRLAGDLSLLFARVAVGSFLVWGVWDNVTSTARMNEFAAFLRVHGFVAPAIMAPLSVAAQLVAGTGLVLGLFTRWAGLLVVANFVVALVMVDARLGIRGAYPSVSLVALGLVFYAFGAGRVALDAMTGRR